MKNYLMKLIEKPYLKNHEGEIIESLHEKEDYV